MARVIAPKHKTRDNPKFTAICGLDTRIHVAGRREEVYSQYKAAPNETFLEAAAEVARVLGGIHDSRNVMMIIGGQIASSRMQLQWPFPAVEFLDDLHKPSPMYVMEELVVRAVRWLEGASARVVVMFEPGILFPSLLMSKLGRFISPSAAEFAITQRLLQSHIRFQPLSGNFPSFRRYLHLLDASLINSALNYKKPSSSIEVEKFRLSGNERVLNMRVIIRNCSNLNARHEFVAMSWQRYERKNENGDQFFCDIYPKTSFSLIDDVQVDFRVPHGNFLQPVASLCFHAAFLDRKSQYLFNKGELDEFQYNVPFESFQVFPIPPKHAETTEIEAQQAVEAADGDYNLRYAELSSASTRRNSRSWENFNVPNPAGVSSQEVVPVTVLGLQDSTSDDEQLTTAPPKVPRDPPEQHVQISATVASALHSTSEQPVPAALDLQCVESEEDEEEVGSTVVPLQISPKSQPRTHTRSSASTSRARRKKEKSPEKHTITNFDDPNNFELKLFNDLMDDDKPSPSSEFSSPNSKGSLFGSINLYPRLFSSNKGKISVDEMTETKKNFQLFLDEHIGGSLEDHVKHMDELRRLWSLSFPSMPVPPRPDDRWKMLGFQGTDPVTDLRAMGALSVKLLCYMAQAYNRTYHEILKESCPLGEDNKSFPFACAGVNICFLLVDGLKLKTLSSSPSHKIDYSVKRCQSTFYELLHGEPNAFNEIFCYTFMIFGREWKARGATYMDFADIANRTRHIVMKELERKSWKSLFSLKEALKLTMM
mmetsp:Transcript_38262/g.120456  ORF Transcript_38262/g.120456 Transcript_38262/m.120456 type:complete len:767 (-) Transcript_38262:52-2352(-)